MDDAPFWRTKTLEELSLQEWESLCDGCGRCCLNKLEDVDTGEISWTDVACRLLDGKTCSCTNYGARLSLVKDCVQLTPQNVRSLTWLPPSCAYRLVAEGHDLYWWHPLVSGDPESVHLAGMSVSGRTVSEADFPEERLEERIVRWPGLRRARAAQPKQNSGADATDPALTTRAALRRPRSVQTKQRSGAVAKDPASAGQAGKIAKGRPKRWKRQTG